MKTSSNSKIFALAILAALLSAESVTAADLYVRPHYKRYRQVASLEYHPSDCRIGWWQTVLGGHVRPRWAVRCRR